MTLPILSTSGQQFTDGTGVPIPLLKGFNVQPSGLVDSHYQDMFNEGARIICTVIFWDKIETSAGTIDPSYIAKLDQHVQSCTNHGMYTWFKFYFGPNGTHSPAWAGGTSNMGTYITHGQFVTQYLAQRYGDVSDPTGAGQYTTAVIGWEINEVTPDESTTADWLINLYAQQSTVIGWYRTYAPDWIAFISSGFGATAPFANAPGSGQTAQTYTTTPANSFASVGGNFALVIHDEVKSLVSGQVGDGRGLNGETVSTLLVKNDDPTYPNYPPIIAGQQLSRATCVATMEAYLAPYVAWCAPTWGNCPLVVGESGFVATDPTTGVNFTGDLALAQDKLTAWTGAGAAIACQWDFAVTRSSDKWAANPGIGLYATGANGWLKWTNVFMGQPIPLQYVSLTLDFYDGAGNPLKAGTAVLQPSAQLNDPVDHEIVTIAPIQVSLATGTPSVTLLATDNANLQPDGWAWTVTFNGVPGNPPGFSFNLPISNGDKQYLSAQAPVQPTAEMAGFLRGTFSGDPATFLNGQGEWTAPAGTDTGSGFVSPLTTQYDLITAGADGVTPVRVPLGADGKFLGAQGGVLGYFTPPTSSGMTNPLPGNGKGAMIYAGDTSGTPAALAVGAAGTFLGSSGGVPAWLTPGSAQFVVVVPSGDTTGVTDTKAIVNAINSLAKGGVVYLAPGVFYITYVAGWSNNITHGGYSGMTGSCVIVPQQTSTGTTGNGPVSIQGSGLGATIVNVVGSFTGFYAHRTSSYGAQFSNPAQPLGGFLRDFTIDGTHATGTAKGLDAGDAWGFSADLAIVNFDGTGQIGCWIGQRVFWVEKQDYRLRLINNATACYMTTTMPNGDWSHEYNTYDIDLFANQNQQGIVSDGVNQGGSRLYIRGNMCQTTATGSNAPTNNVAALTLTNAAGASNASAHRWYMGQIWMKVEGNQSPQYPTGTVFPYGIYSDGVGYIRQCSGHIAHSLTDSKMNGAEFTFYGPVHGDPNLKPTLYA